MDTKAELDQISRGEGILTDSGDILLPSGRTYGIHPETGTVFLRGGPDTIQLTQAEYSVYTMMLKSDGLGGNALRMFEGYQTSGNAGIGADSQIKLQDLYSSRGR